LILNGIIFQKPRFTPHFLRAFPARRGPKGGECKIGAACPASLF
jgi:hypothetical protein